MPFKDPNNVAFIEFLFKNMNEIAAFFLTFLIAVFRTIKQGKMDIAEAVLCGLLTMAGASVLQYFELPDNLLFFVGGMIAFFGTKTTSLFLQRTLKQTLNIERRK